MIVTAGQSVSHIVPEGPHVCTDPVPNRLQGLKPSAMFGGIHPDARGRTMIDRDEHGPLPILTGKDS
jgi:hypothetical protein